MTHYRTLAEALAAHHELTDQGWTAYCVAVGCRCDHIHGVPAETIGFDREDYLYEPPGECVCRIDARNGRDAEHAPAQA